MDARWLPDIGDSLEWNIVARTAYNAIQNGDGTYTPIPPKTWIIDDTYTLMIGIKSSMALSSWYTGAWAAQRLLALPSTTSEFMANVQTCNVRLRLGVLNLFQAPKHQSPWMLYLKIPRWISQATVEIWRYDGRDFDCHDTGAISALPRSVAQSASAVALLQVDPTRKGAIIMNESTSPLAIDLDDLPSMTANLAILQPQGYFEIPYGFKGSVQGIWASAGDGYAKIREFR